MGSGYDIILSVQLTRNKTLSIGQESREGRYVRGGRMVSDFTCPSEIRCFYPICFTFNLCSHIWQKYEISAHQSADHFIFDKMTSGSPTK